MEIHARPAFKNRKMNPYNYLLYSHMQLEDPSVRIREHSTKTLLRGKPDICHFHWPENIFQLPWPAMLRRLPAFVLRIVLARLRGARLVWTVHNMQSHGSLHPAAEKSFKRWLISQLDGLIFLSSDARPLLEGHYPGVELPAHRVIPHGHYIGIYENRTARGEARARLGLDESSPVLLYIGQVRAYKNVPRLIRVFRQAYPDRGATLIVAGSPGSDRALQKEVEDAAAGNPAIHLDLRFIPDDDFQIYLNAADLVVLPYREILNSGSAILALSFLRPVLVPEKGAMGELRRLFGPDWVHTYAGELGPEALAGALNRPAPDDERRDGLRAALERELGWDKIARDTLAFFREILEQEKRP